MDGERMNFFIPITKVNAERREVWGWGAIEEVDNSDEILDYESSKPHFLEWSNRAQKRSGGKSLGNVRSMHKNIAAGKLIEMRADDVSKGFYVGAKIVDDNEWKKVEQGVYTGFSVGGSYQKRWQDFRTPGKTRYTAKPTELSIVDSPCIPSATFEMIKMDGGVENMGFLPGSGENSLEIDTFDEGLEKGEFDENEHPRANDGKFTSGGDEVGGGQKESPVPVKATMNAGDRVKFKSPNPDENPDDEYHVVEMRGDRALIEYHDKDKKFAEGLAPQQVVPTADLTHAGGGKKRGTNPPYEGRNPDFIPRPVGDIRPGDKYIPNREGESNEEYDRRVSMIRGGYNKIEIGDVMEKLEKIYSILDTVEEELQKAIPGAPEPVADLPLESAVGPGLEVEQMPAQSVLMEIQPNAEPSQDVLASHAVNQKDLSSEMEAWLPKVGVIVKSAVSEALAEAADDLSKRTYPAPEQVVVVKRGRQITVTRKEN